MTNGEKYKSIDDRVYAFRRYCAETTCPNCCIKPYVGARRVGYVDRCILKWLTLEVEEKDPLPCPHCGGNAKLFKTQQGGANDPDPDSSIFTEHGAFVKCLGCGCKTEVVWKDCDTPNYIDTAIAIWNRRVK